MTSSGGGGGGGAGEYSLGTATLRLSGDRSQLDRELALLKRYTDQLERQGIKVKFDADTGRATREIDGLQNKLHGLQEMINALSAGVRGDAGAFAGLADQLKGVAGGAGGAGGALSGLMGFASKAIPVLGQLGMAAMGVQAIFQGVSGAINGVIAPLQQLSQEAGRFNKQVAEAGIFASQSFGIFQDGKAVQGTANQMKAIRGAIATEYKEIQKEVAVISGATAAEIYEGFNIILQNIDALGEKGKDLSNVTRLSTRIAAGMNTLGVPGFQLRQEVNALLMGNIGPDAMFAKKLGLDTETVRQKQAAGTYYDFLMEKLEKLYDGQKVLSGSLSNVQSNYQDVFETINSQGGQALEGGMAKGMQMTLATLTNLQTSFMGLMRGISESLQPVLVLLGQVGSVVVSIVSIVSSGGQIVFDALALSTNLMGSVLIPAMALISRSMEVMAKLVELIARGFSVGMRSASSFLAVITSSNLDSINGLFDGLIKRLDDIGKWMDGLSEKLTRPWLEVARIILQVQGQLSGMSQEDIDARFSDAKAAYLNRTGVNEEVDLRSIKFKEGTEQVLAEMDAKYGSSSSSRQLAISKDVAKLKSDTWQNEIKALQQGLDLMQKQRSVLESMQQLAQARRGMLAASFDLGVQLAATPEGKAEMSSRRDDNTLRAEMEAIKERRAMLGVEREIQARQLEIQVRQARIQYEQIKIQQAELLISRDKASRAQQDAYEKMRNAAPGSSEARAAQIRMMQLAREVDLRNKQLGIAREASRLAAEGEGSARRMAEMDGQRTDLQEQLLDQQQQAANYTREQQQLLAQIEARERAITVELEKRRNEQRDIQAGLKARIEAMQQEASLTAEMEKIETARAALNATRTKATVAAAERMKTLQEAQSKAVGGSTADVIEARIQELALGVEGFESSADATRRLYDAKANQLDREQALARRQLEVQQRREESEMRIAELQLRVQMTALAIQKAELQAQRQQLQFQQQRDAMARAAGGSSQVPQMGAAGGAYLQGNIGPTSTGPHFDVKRVGGGYFERNYLDQYVEVNGRPLSSGTTVPGGTFKGHQARGSHGWDFAFGEGRHAATLKGGAQWLGGAKTQHGEARQFRLPTGEVFQFLHGKSEGIGAGTMAGAPPAPALPPPPAAKLRGMQLAMAAAKAAGFTGEQAITMAAVIMAESSANPKAFNGKDKDQSYGLFQINMKGDLGPQRRSALGISSNEELYDPATNARAARMIYAQQGINAWGAYRDGRYTQFLGQARAAAGTPALTAAGGGQADTTTANALDANTTATREADATIERLTKALDNLTNILDPAMRNRQALETTELGERQQGERDQAEYERRVGMLRAQALETPRGRFGAEASDAIVTGLRASLEGGIQALFSGGSAQAVLAQQLEQLGSRMLTGLLDLVLNPLEKTLRETLFKTFSGIDLNDLALQEGSRMLLVGAQALVQATASMSLAGGGGVSGLFNPVSAIAPLAGGALSAIGGLGGFGGLLSGIGSLAFNPAAFSMPSIMPRASGGRFARGKRMLVGEWGPELVEFDQAGEVFNENQAIPFGRKGGRGAAGAGSGGDQPTSLPVPFSRPDLARASQGLYDSAREVNAARAASGGAPLNLKLRLETRTIGGVEYATLDQLQEGMALAAQMGQRIAYQGMRDQPSVRRGLNLE